MVGTNKTLIRGLT